LSTLTQNGGNFGNGMENLHSTMLKTTKSLKLLEVKMKKLQMFKLGRETSNLRLNHGDLFIPLMPRR
jgi:hypothetical protein